jgi:hypothetical protein
MEGKIMKKTVFLVLMALFLISCNSNEPLVKLLESTPTPVLPTPASSPTPSTHEATDDLPAPTPPMAIIDSHHGIYDFFSGEAFIDFAQSVQNGTSDEGTQKPLLVETLSRYYKLKNPPSGVKVRRISATERDVSVIYDTQQISTGFFEYMMVQYSPYYSYDIEKDGLWNRVIPKSEPDMYELENIKYYIWKGMDGENPFWTAEWYNADGYYMRANFPFRFTAEEVLGYISDLERVEIR